MVARPAVWLVCLFQPLLGQAIIQQSLCVLLGRESGRIGPAGHKSGQLGCGILADHPFPVRAELCREPPHESPLGAHLLGAPRFASGTCGRQATLELQEDILKAQDQLLPFVHFVRAVLPNLKSKLLHDSGKLAELFPQLLLLCLDLANVLDQEQELAGKAVDLLDHRLPSSELSEDGASFLSEPVDFNLVPRHLFPHLDHGAQAGINTRLIVRNRTGSWSRDSLLFHVRASRPVNTTELPSTQSRQGTIRCLCLHSLLRYPPQRSFRAASTMSATVGTTASSRGADIGIGVSLPASRMGGASR
jgi:hypothetical protein